MESNHTLLRMLPRVDAALALAIGDVGCGIGERGRPWAVRGHQVYGIDVDPERLAVARRLSSATKPPILFDLARAQALPWPSRSMDLCLVHGALAALPDWNVCLAELARVLRPGGALFLAGGIWTPWTQLLTQFGLACPAGSPLAFKSVVKS